MRGSISSALVGALAIVVAASQAHAQTNFRPERPYRGLFGGGAPAGAGQSLTFNGAVGVGFDDNVRAGAGGLGGGSSDPTRAVSGKLGTLSASLAYQANLGRFGLGASVGTGSRYYPDQGGQLMSAHSANLGVRTQVGERGNLGFSVSANYMPFTFASALPVVDTLELGQFEPPPLSLVTIRQEFLSYSGRADFGYQFSQRLTGNAGYSYGGRSTSLYNTPFSRRGASGGLRYQLGQGLGLRIGYSRMEGRYGSPDNNAAQDSVNGGIDFSRALSFSRRTSVSFSTGSTAVRNNSRTRVRMIGTASLAHEVGRTWMASANYTRGVQFLEVLLEPVFQDSVGAGFGGLVNRRVQVQTSIRASIGQVGFRTTGNSFDTYVAGAGASVALTSFMNFGVNYSYFQYKFDEGTVLPAGIPSEIGRQSISATVSFWAPLIRSAR
jgi:hypothetical protein